MFVWIRYNLSVLVADIDHQEFFRCRQNSEVRKIVEPYAFLYRRLNVFWVLPAVQNQGAIGYQGIDQQNTGKIIR
jgi:hypothetical protein